MVSIWTEVQSAGWAHMSSLQGNREAPTAEDVATHGCHKLLSMLHNLEERKPQHVLGGINFSLLLGLHQVNETLEHLKSVGIMRDPQICQCHLDKGFSLYIHHQEVPGGSSQEGLCFQPAAHSIPPQPIDLCSPLFLHPPAPESRKDDNRILTSE